MILITGASGQLGFELGRLFQQNHIPYVGMDLPDLDITNPESVRSRLDEFAPRIVINCAAYTAVDRAEGDREAAFRVNGEGPLLLAQACEKSGAFLVHISTDFVFGSSLCEGENSVVHPAPWKTTDAPLPRGVYAESKYEGERSILDFHRRSGRDPFENTAIIRTSWVYSAHGANFPKTMLRLASDENRSQLTVIEDQIGRPTWAGSLALFILKLLESGPSGSIRGGLYHFSNSGVASWYDFALATVEMAHELGLLSRRIPVLPIPTEAYPLPAPRPRFSVLDLASARTVMPEIPHWREDLRRFLVELKNGTVSLA